MQNVLLGQTPSLPLALPGGPFTALIPPQAVLALAFMPGNQLCLDCLRHPCKLLDCASCTIAFLTDRKHLSRTPKWSERRPKWSNLICVRSLRLSKPFARN